MLTRVKALENPEHDQLSWPAALVVAPYQTRIGIQSSDPWIMDKVRESLLPGWQEEDLREPVDLLLSICGTAESGYVYYQDGLPVSKNSSLEALLRDFEGSLHILVGATACERTFLHAGVVGWKGKAMLFPGRSRAGKSSLVEALVSHGATYYSDDLAAIDAAGLVHPYPKPLSMRRGPWQNERTPAARLGWRADLLPLEVGAIVAVRHDPACTDLCLEKTGPGEAVFLVLENCVSIRGQAARDIACLARLCSSIPCFQGTRGEAFAAAPRLLSLLEDGQ